MHCDLWQPGLLADPKKRIVYDLNYMCDFTEFIVSSLVHDPNAAVLAEIFMREVVLSFGMVAVIVVNAYNKLRGAFEEVCNNLKITFCPLMRGNHKGNIVERCHRFLKKIKPYVYPNAIRKYCFLSHTTLTCRTVCM